MNNIFETGIHIGIDATTDALSSIINKMKGIALCKVVVATGAFSFLPGCDFIGSDEDRHNTGSTPDECDAESVNCGLNGTLFYLNSEGYVSHNVGIGEVSVIKDAGPTWAFGLGANKSGNKFIGVFDRIDSSSSYDTVEVFDESGNS